MTAMKYLNLERMDDIRAVMERFGLGYEATRHHLNYLGLLDMNEDVGPVSVRVPEDWERAEPSANERTHRKALDAGVSMLRAGAFFGLVWRAYRHGVLSDSAARDELRLTEQRWRELKLAHAGQRGDTWSTWSNERED